MYIMGNELKETSGEKENNESDEHADKAPEYDQANVVSVIVRVRPLSTVEHSNPSIKSVVQCLKDGIVVHGVSARPPSRFFGARHAQPRPQHFKVDKVFHPYSTQIEVYGACRDIVAGVFDGVNGSVLAYGATGAGKTHTMFGGSMSMAGVIYQAVQDLLDAKERLEQEEKKVVTIRCTFLEVYNEEVYDLLAVISPRVQRKPLKVQGFCQESYANDIKNDVNPESFTVKGLTHATPNNAEEFTKIVELGQTNRFVACTHANAQSSRSHAILTVEVEVKDTVDASLGTIGRIRFCDLAGSERAAGTSNSGIRLHEGGTINRSLLALGAVVQALTRRKKNLKKPNYIPYRGSKLTRLLRDCLSGNCRTLMLFCVSPSSMNYEETINTMLFAMQAKEIQVVAKRHEYRVNSKEVAKSQEVLIEELRLELAQTRDELLRLKGGSFSGAVSRAQISRQTSQPFPVLTPQSAELSPNKGEPLSALLNTTITTESERRTDLLDALPGSFSQSHRVLSRMPMMTEGAEAYVELEKKLKAYSVEKEALYREMGEAQEVNSELDIRLRQHKWKLARFLSTRRKSMNGETHEERVTPVGVAGLRLAIKNMETESAAQGGEMERLLAKMNATDRTIAGICQELLREKQHPFLELLLDNVKLRQSSTEAECLAAHYHQECRCIKNREEEYAQALCVCVSTIRHLLPLLSGSPAHREEAQLALMFANLPSLSTADMIPVFERSLKTGSTPSVLFVDPHFSTVSTGSMGACLQRLANDPSSSSSGNVSRPPQQCRSGHHVKVTPTSGTSQGRGPSAKKVRALANGNTVHMDQEPIADSHSAIGSRSRVVQSTTLTRKLVGNQYALIANGKRSVSFGATKRTTIAASASPLRAGNDTNGAVLTRAKSKGVRGASALSPFGRVHTASEALRNTSSCLGIPTPLAARGGSFEQVRRLQQTSLPSHVSSSADTNSDAAHSRQKRGTLATTRKNSIFSSSEKRLQNTYLEERYHRLLTEVRQWHGTAGATIRAHHTAHYTSTNSNGKNGA